MNKNRLSGSIDHVTSLVALNVLSLANNSFTGSIPSSIGNLVQLVKLDLSNNSLSGSIPDTVSNLVHLQILQLFSNQITGDIPPSIYSSIANLMECNLSPQNTAAQGLYCYKGPVLNQCL